MNPLKTAIANIAVRRAEAQIKRDEQEAMHATRIVNQDRGPCPCAYCVASTSYDIDQALGAMAGSNEHDFLALAISALDQAGVSDELQEQVRRMVLVEKGLQP